jgi:hypothetical protein
MRVYLIGLAAFAAACSHAGAAGGRAAFRPVACRAAIAAAGRDHPPQDFYARIGFLASDALQGRDTPSPGLEAAAAYISSEFYRSGSSRPAKTAPTSSAGRT